MTIIDRLMVLFRIPNISYLVLNRETRKRVVNTRGGAKMIGHTLARQIQTKPPEKYTNTKVRIMNIQKSEQHLLLICTAQGGFKV